MKKLLHWKLLQLIPEELKIFANAIKKLYLERGYYNAPLILNLSLMKMAKEPLYLILMKAQISCKTYFI